MKGVSVVTMLQCTTILFFVIYLTHICKNRDQLTSFDATHMVNLVNYFVFCIVHVPHNFLIIGSDLCPYLHQQVPYNKHHCNVALGTND
jgi:hypothetical protein